MEVSFAPYTAIDVVRFIDIVRVLLETGNFVLRSSASKHIPHQVFCWGEWLDTEQCLQKDQSKRVNKVVPEHWRGPIGKQIRVPLSELFLVAFSFTDFSALNEELEKDLTWDLKYLHAIYKAVITGAVDDACQGWILYAVESSGWNKS